MNTLQRRATIGSQSTASLNTVNSNTSTERKSLFTAEAHLLSLYSEEEPPTPTLLNQLLELALDCNGLKDTNRLPFYQFSTDKKLVFIKNMVRKLNERHEPTQDKSNSKEPKFYIEYLTSATIEISKQYNRTTAALHYVGSIARTLSTKTSTMLQQYSFPDIKSILAQLRAECSCQDASWLFSFVENGGLKALFGLLQVIQSKVDKKTKHYEAEADILKIVKIVVNINSGIKDLLSCPSSLNVIITSIDSPNITTRLIVVDFLLGSISQPTGHKLVIDAFKLHQGPNQGLFEGFLTSLMSLVEARGIWGGNVGARYNGDVFVAQNNLEKRGGILQKEINEYLISAITLIRYIIQVPSDILVRIFFRNKMVTHGLLNIIQKLKTWAQDEFPLIFSQVKSIEDESNSDLAEFFEQLSPCMESVGIDINDTRTLVEILSDGGCIESVKSILQLLLVASYTTEGEIKRKYFWFIEEIIAKIILDQKGISPDFTDHFGTCVFDVVDRILLDDERNQEGGTLFQKLQNAQRKISSLENDYNVLVKSRNVGALTSGFVENDQIKSRDRIIETLRNEMKSYRDETDRELIQVRKKLQDALDSTKTRDSKGNASTTEISEDAIPRDSKFSAVSSSNSKNVSTTEMSEETPTFYTPTTSIQNLTEVESSTVLVPSGPVPPPPPPPMMGGPIGAPPPPPFGISSATPKRVQKYYPLVEVKKLQWEKINDQDMKKSIWAKKMTIKLDSEKDDEIEKFLNEAGLFTRIEANFATRIIKQEKVNVPSNQAKIIDPKRSMNIMIMLNQLKKHTLVELRDGILQLNEDIYTPQVIKNCLKFIPTSKEEMLLKNADDKNIDVSEKFMVNMMNVFRYQQRLTCLLFKIEGVQELNDLSNRVETTIKSFETLKKANAFQKLLQIVLNIGNFLNHGTSRGGYHGFSISSLNKLCDMKTSDNQKSLLYYLVELVEQKFLLVKEFKNELEIVVESCKFQFSLILEDLIEFRKSIELVNSELVVHREKGDEVFLNVMEPFYNEMESSLVQFNKRHEKMESLINETMVLYAADQKTKPDEFLAIFKTFLDSYNSTYKVFLKDLEKEALLEKKKRTQMAREIAKKEAELALQIVSPAAENEESKGKLDDLLASLKTGQAPVRRPVQKEIAQISRKSSVLNEAIDMLNKLEF